MSKRRDVSSMSVAAFVERLEKIERSKGVDRLTSRQAVARRIGIAPGTVENIARGRKKSVAGWIENKIKRAVAHAIEQEMRALEAELALVRASGIELRDDEMAAAQAAVDQARAILRRAKTET